MSNSHGKTAYNNVESYVWYASYGSNILKERFMYYVKGGICRFNGTLYEGCSDKSEPLDVKQLNIPYRLYFAKSSRSWENHGVAFLEPIMNSTVRTLGRMYLITKEQFYDIQLQEGKGWYNHILDIGKHGGIPIKSFTHFEILPYNLPSEKYLEVIKSGIMEAYPEMSMESIDEYIRAYSF